MKIRLPKHSSDGQTASITLSSDQCLLIIGANGAGKTRFTAATAQLAGAKAYPLSALEALHTRLDSVTALAPSIQQIFSPATAACYGSPTLLELYLSQLINDEIINLIGYKMALADKRQATLKATRLDKVIELWQDIFPGNRVLIDRGKILFSRGNEGAEHSAVRLSHGERAVLFYVAAILYAPHKALIFVDSPEIFLHPSLTSSLWNRLEALRSYCTFCYSTHDTEFASSRNGAQAIWVRDCDPADDAWDYELIPAGKGFSADLYMTLSGARKPMLFIEGDSERSIDAKLYPLIFPSYTVRSLGSCNKVIEATRTFNDLSDFHKMDSCGIVDRDRRNEKEVAYLRNKKVMVPEVAEIENILLLEDVVAAMAEATGNDPARVTAKVKRAVINMFKTDLHAQALLHTRHRVKRTMEYRADNRSADISTFERHLDSLLEEIRPRDIYEDFCREFHSYVTNGDYNAILRVYNQKSILPGCNVAQMCGFSGKESYIEGILDILRRDAPQADAIRRAVRRCLTGEERDKIKL